MSNQLYSLGARIGLISFFFGISIGAPLLTNAQETTREESSSDAVAEVSEVASLSNLYPVERIPGGDAVVGDFVVGPGKVDIDILPGQSRTVEMMVTNRTGEQRKFNVTVEDATGSQDPKQAVVLLGDDRGPYTMKDYVTVPHWTFILGHNERARVPVTISLPADAEPGGRYGSVLIDTVTVEAEGGETESTAPQTAIVARIGTLFFITIPGEIAYDGNLKDFGTVPKKTFYQGGPIAFGLLFENRGSTHLSPYGELRVNNMFGEEVGQMELEPWFVFPMAQRLREVTWNREFLFGKYTVTAYINRSYDDVIDEMSYSFWVLPWKIVLGTFAVLFVVFFLIRLFFKNFEFRRK